MMLLRIQFLMMPKPSGSERVGLECSFQPDFLDV